MIQVLSSIHTPLPLPLHPPTLYVFISILSREICDLKEAINACHTPALAALGATLHISCLSATNGPWGYDEKIHKAEKREGCTKRGRGRRDGEVAGEEKMKGHIQISLASMRQWM